MTKATLVFDTTGKKTTLADGVNILDAARTIEIGISAVCGGRGLCGKCRVIVQKGRGIFEPISKLERLSLSEEELDHGYRLACCTKAMHDGTAIVEVPPESSIEQQRLQVAGIETAVPVDPVVKKLAVTVTLPQLPETRSDAECLLAASSSQHGLRGVRFGHDALMQLPYAIRQGRAVTITLRGEDKITWVEAGDRPEPPLGLAVDIGTTKLAAYLLDLREGKIIATASSPNPQIEFGDDVISRISYVAKDKKNLKQLQGIIVAAVNKLLLDACRQKGVEATEVSDVVVVGNTVMHHLFLGVDPQFLAMSPYPPVVRSGITVNCKAIGLRTNPGAYVYLLPAIAGFVGGDALADILATQLHKARSPTLLIDIGTNTEIVLSDGRSLIACSCASGPALEGGCVQHGMRAETGAIERVYIDPENFEPGYATVGDVHPRGICGSGVVDAVACMLKSGIIDRGGRINTELRTPRIRVKEGFAEYVLAWKDEDEGQDISVTQNDIQAIQLAKAAIFAAVFVLMTKLAVRPRDLQQILLAGAFGTYVDPQSALLLGMYPDVPLSRIRFVGNSAGSGARMALISSRVRSEAEQIARETEYVELAADQTFHDEFMKALYMPHRNEELFPTITKFLARHKTSER